MVSKSPYKNGQLSPEVRQRDLAVKCPPSPVSPMMLRQTSTLPSPLPSPLPTLPTLRISHRKVVKFLVTASLVLNLVSIPILFGVYFGSLTHCSTLDKVIPDIACLPCHGETIPGVQLFRTRNGFCCADSRDSQFAKLEKKHFFRFSSLVSGECGPDCVPVYSKSRKHNTGLTFGRFMVDFNATCRHKELRWLKKYPYGLAFVMGNLTVIDGWVKVTEGGIFRIRSRLNFDTVKNSFPASQGKDFIIRHAVKKQGDVFLGRNRLSLARDSYQTSHLDLTVRLMPPDMISVDVNTFDFFYKYSIANTLEVHKLSS